MIYEYPKKTKFGKMVAKSKIYKHANASSALKDKFKAQIDKITWSYKLAPETLNLNASDSVSEIQIFDVKVKIQNVSEELLRVIDKVIPFPIIFQLYYEDKIKIKAAYKRPSDADSSKWVIESYFESEWLDADTQRESLPVALDLTKLYEKMLQVLMPDITTNSTSSSIKEQVSHLSLIHISEPTRRS